MKLKFGIRTLLLVVLLVAIFSACYAFFERRGQKQLAAVRALQDMGVSSFENVLAIDIQRVSYPGPNGSFQSVGLPVVSVSNDRHKMARQFLGDAAFVEYSSLIIQQPIDDLVPLVALMKELPYLKEVQIYTDAMTSTKIKDLQKCFPSIEFVRINENAPPSNLFASPRKSTSQ